MSIRRLIVATLAIGACAAILGVASASDAGKKDAAKKDDAVAVKTGRQILNGEIIDLDCYFPDPEGGRGAVHAECAQQCIASGNPAGFLVGDRLYLVVLGGGAVDSKALGAAAGRPVELTGTVMYENGMAALFVESIGTAEGKAPAR